MLWRAAAGANVAVRVPRSKLTTPVTGAPPAVGATTSDAAVIVAASSGSSNVTAIDPVIETAELAFAGEVDVTTGGTSSFVENENVKSAASLLPPVSFTPVVMETVIAAELGSIPSALNSARRVAVVYVTVPGTVVFPGPLTMNVVVLIVVGSRLSLNVAPMLAARATTLVPAAGLVVRTAGAVTSGAVIVAAGDSEESSDSSPDTPLAET